MRWSRTALPAHLPARRLLGSAVLAAGLAFGLVGGGAAAGGARTAVFTGYGFETCEAPTVDQLDAWLTSPYRAVGIYIGGVNRTCPNLALTSGWIASVLTDGWSLIPTYVGLQPPCVTNSRRAHFTAANAQAQGGVAGADAIAAATALGLPSGSPLYLDLEAYATHDPACTQAALRFVSAWVDALHARGYVAGVYGSAGSVMRDLQQLASTPSSPDDIWIGNWDGRETVFGDPYVSDTLWANHQRLHQYRGGHRETFGGVTINIDSDYLDGAVVTTLAAPRPQPTGGSGTASSAGSTGSGDGQAKATWERTTFTGAVAAMLEPLELSAPIAGFDTGGYAVSLSITDASTFTPVNTFAGALGIHIAARGVPAAPLYATNQTTWKPIPELLSPDAPLTGPVGFTRRHDGSVDIRTSIAANFALMPDHTHPTTARLASAHLVDGVLRLGWHRSADSNGPVAAYAVTLANHPAVTVDSTTRHAGVSTFHGHAPSVFRIVAFDNAGNQSAPSKPVVVLPSKRPADLPRALPSWAWQFYDWQRSKRATARPVGAPKAIPRWYWSWAAWRTAPFHLRGA